MTRLAVFDWNCTLIDDVEACLTAKNAALAYLGHGPLDLAGIREVFTFPIIHAYERAGVHPDHYLAHAEAISEIFIETYEREAQKCGLRPGVIDTLEWLHACGIPAIVLSNHLEHLLRPRIEAMGIAGYFEAILGTDSYATIVHKMDKQERLQAYMQENGYQAKHSLIIGDTHEEAELARNLGLTSISITGGLFSRKRLEACRPDYIIDHVGEMIDICRLKWSQTAHNADERGTTGTAG